MDDEAFEVSKIPCQPVVTDARAVYTVHTGNRLSGEKETSWRFLRRTYKTSSSSAAATAARIGRNASGPYQRLCCGRQRIRSKAEEDERGRGGSSSRSARSMSAAATANRHCYIPGKDNVASSVNILSSYS